MKTIKDLVQLFDGDKTEVELSEGIIARRDNDGDINFKDKETESMFGWLSGSYSKDDEDQERDLAGVVSLMVPSMLSKVGLFLEFALWIGSEMPDAMTVEVEKEVEVIKEIESNEKHKLSGKVEAYENILLGRDVTVAK